MSTRFHCHDFLITNDYKVREFLREDSVETWLSTFLANKEMKMKKLFILLPLLIALSSSADVTLNCKFSTHIFDTVHRCTIKEGVVPDDETVNISFADGDRNQSVSVNLVVNQVHIEYSSIPFIIVDHVLKTFPNVKGIWILTSGLTRIQPNAFVNAGNLEQLNIKLDPDLQVIPANAFLGASKLQDLQIYWCGVHTIHENAFNGLDKLTRLSLGGSKIHRLPSNVLQPLTALFNFGIAETKLEVIDEQLFKFNKQIVSIYLSQNRINAVGPKFFDDLDNLRYFSFERNLCADNQWEIGSPSGVTKDTIRDGLATCFENYAEHDVKKFTVQLRGHLIIRSANGTEVARL